MMRMSMYSRLYLDLVKAGPYNHYFYINYLVNPLELYSVLKGLAAL